MSKAPSRSWPTAGSLILVVDDVPRNLQVVGKMLQGAGYDPLPCGDGLRAIELAILQKPALILLDLRMPVLDGFEVCRRLKADPRTAEIPVIFLTASDEKEKLVQAFEMGAVDFVAKPFHPAELLARVRTHLELQSSRNYLAGLNAEKNRFLEMAAHDLNNPLTVIQGSLEVIEQVGPSDPATLRRMASQAQQMTQRMIHLIRDLLNVNAIETGQRQITSVPLAIELVVTEIIDAYRTRAESKQIFIDKVFTGGPFRALLDRGALSQVLENLVSNALKFSPAKTRITISLSTHDSFHELAVKDQGPGLTDQDKTLLFGKFCQLSARPTGGESSTGLGLSIAKNLVEAMDGSIRCESEAGQGASFIVRFPAVP